jgi:hypothetical protein
MLPPLPEPFVLPVPASIDDVPPFATGAAEHAPEPSSGQHERGSGYVVAPLSHGVKGAPG